MAVLNTTQLGAGIRAPARKTGDESKESTGGMFDHSGAWIVLTFFFFHELLGLLHQGLFSVKISALFFINPLSRLVCLHFKH